MRITNKRTGQTIEVGQLAYRADQVRSLAAAAVSKITHSPPSQEVINLRRQSCQACEYLDSEADRCRACGCRASLRWKIEKLPTVECPSGKAGFANEGRPWRGFEKA